MIHCHADRYKHLFLKRIIYGAESSESLVISSFDFPVHSAASLMNLDPTGRHEGTRGKKR